MQKTLAERFWPKVKIAGPDECWEWQASLNKSGYGQLNAGGRGMPIVASRASWLIHFGPIPDQLCVLHRCDNRSCVNPQHLFLGTRTENHADMVAKGRVVVPETPRFYGDAHWLRRNPERAKEVALALRKARWGPHST